MPKSVTVEDPVKVGSGSCDGQGRLYLGPDYENKEVEFVIEEVTEKDD